MIKVFKESITVENGENREKILKKAINRAWDIPLEHSHTFATANGKMYPVFKGGANIGEINIPIQEYANTHLTNAFSDFIENEVKGMNIFEMYTYLHSYANGDIDTVELFYYNTFLDSSYSNLKALRFENGKITYDIVLDGDKAYCFVADETMELFETYSQICIFINGNAHWYDMVKNTIDGEKALKSDFTDLEQGELLESKDKCCLVAAHWSALEM